MDFHVNFPEDEHEQEMIEVEVFSVIDDEGNEDFFKKLDEITYEGGVYWVCQEVFLDPELTRIEEEGDIHVFREVETQGEKFIEYVKNYDLAKRIFDMWEERLKDEEEDK